jgi:hypothetical protein
VQERGCILSRRVVIYGIDCIVKRIVFSCLFVLCVVAHASGQSKNHISIEDLRHLRLPDVVLESATAVAPDLQKNPNAAAYVEVKGVIGGNIRFELLLPEAWNGRFVMGGGGGFVGTVQNSAQDSVNHGYATVGTDTGHEWQPGTRPVGRSTMWRRN